MDKLNPAKLDPAKLDPALGAAIFLLLAQHGVRPDWKGWPSSEAEILAFTGADRDEAHALRERVHEALLLMEKQSERDPPVVHLQYAMAGFHSCHPGAVSDIDGKRVYSDEFRDFVAAIRDPGEMGDSVSPAEVALAASIPLDLYNEWVRNRAR
jgi:hypothetical protein